MGRPVIALGVDVRAHREDQAGQRPVDHRDPVQVAAADDQVADRDLAQELRQRRRVVAEVRVHLEDRVVVGRLEDMLEAGAVGRTEPCLRSRSSRFTRPPKSASPRTMAAVPSGELSSTTSTESRGSWARICGTRRPMFSASL
jgi:hypothetical protein